MFFGTQEIEKIEDGILTLKSGEEITITDKNKDLVTEEATTGSDLQERMAKAAAIDIIEVLRVHNIRMTDLNLVMNFVSESITWKNDEATVKAFGKEKLDNFSKLFGANDNVASVSVRSIRFQDIFNS